MDALAYWLPLVWIVILGAAVALYVVLDGFDLGLGILFPFSPEEQDRDVMMNSVAPFWDGNETWLVFGGGGLLVAFPLAYSIIMPALYLPVIIMLLALVFRGVAFEFRWVAKPNHAVWDKAFVWGSTVATFMQGVILAGLLNGISVEDNAYAGGTFDWLSPFSVFVGAALVAGYALLGATWLVMKTEGPTAAKARVQAKTLLLLLLGSMAVVSLWTPLAFDRIFDRWFSLPNVFYLAPLPALTAVAAYLCWRGLRDENSDVIPFAAAIALFLLGYVGLAISNFPYVIPPSVTIWQAAAPPSSQIFILLGTVFMLPVILGYMIFVHWTFRGKVRPGEGYH